MWKVPLRCHFNRLKRNEVSQEDILKSNIVSFQVLTGSSQERVIQGEFIYKGAMYKVRVLGNHKG